MNPREKKILIIAGIMAGVILMLKTSGGMVERMAGAIKSFEGWAAPGETLGGKLYPKGSLSYQNNNPGNLKMAGQAGAVGADPFGHAIFGSYDLGWTALVNHINRAFMGLFGYSPEMSLYDFFRKYAEGNSIQYAEYVAGKLNVSPSDSLSQILVGG